jgi:hypothetical protein
MKQRTVITLSKENKELNERNESLRRQLMEIGAKVSLFYTHQLFRFLFFRLPRHVVHDALARSPCDVL